MSGPLITAEDLQRELEGPAAPVVLDVRWTLDEPDGHSHYLASHIPGAIYVDLEEELSAHGEPLDGRHPLPTRERLQAAARDWGINLGDAVVVYDNSAGYGAARAWWLLRHAGIESVRLLDGGLGAWIATGAATAEGEQTRAAGDIELSWGHMPVIDVDQADAFPASGHLLDARATARFRGEIEPLDPKAGHIPGAVSMPTTDNVGPDGRFLTADELTARFAALGAGPVAVYCGSGVSAAQQIAALEITGRRAALYPGSWSQWSNMDLPVATG